MDRRHLRHRETRDEIVAAAEELVLTGDPESLTVHAVARAVGVTPAALYRYFPSRDAIVAAAEARVVADVAQAVDAAVAAAPSDPILRLVAAGDAVVAFSRTSPQRYALLSRMLALPRRLLSDDDAAPVLAVATGVLGRVLALFAAARESGALAPGDDAERVLVLWAAVHGALHLGKFASLAPSADPSVLGRAAIDALFVGWGADRARLARPDAGPSSSAPRPAPSENP